MHQLPDLVSTVLAQNPVKIILSKPAGKDGPYQKIVIQKLTDGFLAEAFTHSQAFHQNIPPAGLQGYIGERMPGEFLQLNAFTATHEYSVRITKKGAATLSKSVLKNTVKTRETHNRQKQYILPEGSVIPPLVDMGVFTSEGKVVRSMYDKYRQINRFIEVIDDLVAKENLKSVKVIDYGCGKGYLTFLLYHYLTAVRGLSVAMVGIDIKKDVIDHCNASAKKYGYTGLTFFAGDLTTYVPDFTPDIIVSLHACDTLTDYVLYHACVYGARMIFSMPCCQHEVASQMQTGDFAALTRYGALKEKTAAIFTDAIRANLLTCLGYRVQIIEVVNPLNTPKNLMIRAVKDDISPAHRQKALAEVHALQNAFSLKPTLYRLLKDAGKLTL